MIKKRYLILILCIITILSIQFVSANDNTDNMTVLGVSGEESILQAPSETQSYTDLNTIINQAGEGDEINLTYNYEYRNGNDPKTGINITKNLVINGNGATINGNDVSSLFNISEGVTVTLKNLTITHAAALVGWSEPFTIYRAIESKGTLYLEDCTFTDNSIANEWQKQLEVNGSVIHSNKDVFIDNCIFYNNKVQSCGVVYTTGRVFVNNSEFDTNEAYRSIKGVAIYAVGAVSINNTYFGSNEPKVHNDDPVLPKGGAIYTETGIDVIENCEFEYNYGTTGGAIYIANPDAVTSIKNSIFYGNGFNSDMGGTIYTKGKIDLIENSEFDTNHALVGAGIYATSINKIDNSTFDNNGYNNPGSKGGAIYLTGNDDLFINNSHIDDNLGWEGAGIYTHGGVTILNSNLTHNAGDDYQFTTKGSSIYANGDVYIENVTMRDNFAVEGGVVYSNGTVTIKNSKDIGNNGVYGQHVTSKGGVFYAKGDVNIENTTFGENNANLAGGAVYSEGNVNFYNSKVNGSAATSDNGDGGFIYAKGNVNVENATISDVYMKVGDQGKEFSGAVYAGGDMIIRNATFDHINKEHHSYGGAICVLGNVVIYNSNFTNNQAVLYAAGYVNGTLDIYDCIFTNNSDGAIFSEGNAVVNSTKFINNTISGSAMYGIAIGSNGTLNLTNSYVYGSNAHDSNYRGSVFSKNNLYVENCTFDEIHSEAGTATGMIISTKSNASIINTEFLDFSYHGSTIYGGSIYAGVNAYVENCTFFNATLVNQNGQTHGLCIYSEENITLYNSNLIDIDSSNGQNGAVKGGNYVYVFNSTFINITGARSSGGAIYANVANVTNSSFYRILCSDNADKGGAIYANDTYIYYNNFTNCHAGVGGAIYSLNYTTAIQNIFINNSNQYSGGAIYTKNGFIQYNVILENMGHTWNLPADIAIVDSIVDSLEYNWWGENVPFGTEDKQKRVQVNVQSSQGTYFLPDTWVLMDFYVNPNQDFVGQGLNLTTTLDHYLNNTEPEGSNIHDLDHNIAKRTVVYKAINKTAEEQAGWFSHDTAPIINQDYVLYSNNNFLKHNVSATIDYQTLYLTVAQFHVNVTKNVTDLTPEVDDEITYTILVNNTDTTDYSDPSAVIEHPTKINITITDILDPRLKFISANDTNYNPITGEWFIENIDINGTIALTIKVKVLKGGNITNYANVTKINDNVLTNPYGANVTIQVPLVYKLDVNKTVDKKEVVLGDKVTFTINVTNIGSGNLTNVTVIDKLPSGFEFNSSDDARYNNKTGKLIITQLEEGQSVVFHIVALTTTEGLLTNNVNATCDENKTEFKSSVSVDVKPFVNLTVSKSVNVTSVLVGDKLKYTITVKNVGLSTATGVNVTDVVDSSLVEVIKGESSGGYDTVVANGWRIASLAPGQSETLILVVKINAAGTIVNSVAVNSSENKTPVTNKSVDVDADPFVNLAVSKSVNVTAADVVLVGDKLKYTIVVKNVGLSTATGVNVTDVADSGLVEVLKGESSDGYDTVVANGWRVASLAPNGEVTFYLVVKINAAGTIVNSVGVNCSENKTPVTNKSDDVDANPNSGLSITKKANVTSVIVGDLVEYTITVKNNGLSDVTGVKVWDILPVSVTYKGGADAYDVNMRNATWTIDSIAASQSFTVTLIVNVTSAGNVTNTAFANCNENKTVVNKTSDNVTANPNVKLTMDKVANVTSVVVGDLVEYTITVRNVGLSDASGVNVWDILPIGVKYVSGGSYDVDSRNVTWTIDSIVAGKFAVVTLIVNVTSVGNVTNTAFANCNENKTVVNEASDNVTVGPNVKLTMDKVANVTEAYVGDDIKFTITVTNNGLSEATIVTIEDMLPDSVKFISANGTYTNVGQKVVWTIDKMPTNSSVDVYVIVKAVTSGSLVNSANVTCAENSTSKTNTSEIDVKPVVKFNVVKSANVSNIFIGDKVGFNITVTNNGPSNASNVIVVDMLPAGLKFISSSLDCVVKGNEVSWNVSKLNNGEIIVIEVICEAVGAGDLINTVNVTCDENKTSTTGETPIHVSELVDVAIILSVNNTKPDINGEIIITLVLRNYGPSTATDITGKLNKDFLRGLEIISIDSKDIIFHSDDLLSYALSDILRFNEDGTFELAYLEANNEASATIKARVISDGNLTIDGIVSSHEKDSNLSNNYGELTLNVHSLVDLSVDVTANDTTPTVGDEIEYTIVVVNKGPSNATDIIVKDKLPDGVTYISDSSGGAYNPVTGVWTIDDMKPGENRTLTINVKVDVPGEITNFVDVNSSQDNLNPEGSKNNVTINVKDFDKVDLRLTKTANATKAYVGDLVVYTITVSNKGSVNATGVLVYEDLLDGLRYISDDSNGRYDPTSGIWNISNLNAGENMVLNILVQLTKAGNIINYAIVVADQKILNITESFDNVTIEVVEHAKNETDNETFILQKGDIRLKEVGNPLMILMLALLSAGTFLRRKKQ